MYRLKFIDNFRFISTSLSSLVDNLSEKLIVISVKIVNLNLIICHSKIISYIFNVLSVKRILRKTIKN